jgi:hypothetical protein
MKKNKKEGKPRAFEVHAIWEEGGILIATSAAKAKAAVVLALNEERICDYIGPGEYGPWRAVGFKDVRAVRAPHYDRLVSSEVLAIEKNVARGEGWTYDYADDLLARAFPVWQPCSTECFKCLKEAVCIDCGRPFLRTADGQETCTCYYSPVAAPTTREKEEG